MIIYSKGHNYKYEIEKLIRLFFPFEKINFCEYEEQKESECKTETLKEKAAVLKAEKATDEIYTYTSIVETDENFIFSVTILDRKNKYSKEKTTEKEFLNDPDTNKAKERLLALLIYDCLTEMTGYAPEWGILTGIRPAKLFKSFVSNIKSDDPIKVFKDEFKVSNKKMALLSETAEREKTIISHSKPQSVSIYISIPFCPSRCSYCSFVSHSIESAENLIPEYLKLLLDEIEYTGDIINKLGLKVMTVYVGGGTPTTLSALQLNTLLKKINSCFSNGFEEFTVEAGRPDTIDKEKLAAIFESGVSRISINPQTMNDSVLMAIQRRHTAAQTVAAYETARNVGFKNINMDLIAGLPTDTEEGFRNTVNEIIKLNPESVTVHSLSLKRSSRLNISGDTESIGNGILAGKMVDYACDRLKSAGILPYYMYRQSKTVGNLENVGYAKPGYEGLYNVYIMDETHTILACGASAVTKLKDVKSGKIERIFNYKYPYEYISKYSEIINRKKRVEEFYNEYPFKY